MKLIIASLVLLMAFHQALTVISPIVPRILRSIDSIVVSVEELVAGVAVAVLELFGVVICDESELLNCTEEIGLRLKLVDLLTSSSPNNLLESIVDELSYCISNSSCTNE